MTNEITFNNRTYRIEATGLKHVAYKLYSGKKVVTGYRSMVQPNIIVVRDASHRHIGAFNEETGRAVVAVK